jgi:hypothetical protein
MPVHVSHSATVPAIRMERASDGPRVAPSQRWTRIQNQTRCRRLVSTARSVRSDHRVAVLPIGPPRRDQAPQPGPSGDVGHAGQDNGGQPLVLVSSRDLRGQCAQRVRPPVRLVKRERVRHRVVDAGSQAVERAVYSLTPPPRRGVTRADSPDAVGISAQVPHAVGRRSIHAVTTVASSSGLPT